MRYAEILMSQPVPDLEGLRFVASRWRHMVALGDHPLVVLERGHPWDDHGYKTLFQIYFHSPRPGAELQHLGAVKILQQNAKETHPPEGELAGLSEDFCSLGQSPEYYQKVRALGDQTARAILLGLRDIVFHPETFEVFRGDEGLEKSLLRSSAARAALREGNRLLQGQPVERAVPLRFEFSCDLQERGFSEPHMIDFEFFPQDGPLGRIVALVGKNATGKSALLRALVRHLSGLDPKSGTVKPEHLRLDLVIVIAYSAFDPYTFYKRGRPAEGVAYRYCGLRDESGRINIEKAFKDMERRFVRLRDDDNQERWRDVMRHSGLFDAEPHLQDPFENGNFTAFVEQMKSLSAGHQIILFVLTNLIATIRPGSLLLFDEPDLHLHPNMLTRLMRLLHAVLEDFDSYAILATHSPQVLQEIPARSIRIIERDGTVPSIRRYPRETFGANLGEITELAFGVDERDRNYYRMLVEIAEKHGRDWLDRRVEEIFGEPLSLAPRTLLSWLRQGMSRDEEADTD